MNAKSEAESAAWPPGERRTVATRPGKWSKPTGRQLLIAMRADLLAPIEAIVGYSQMLLDDTGDRPPTFQEDVAKLHAATKQLYQFVKRKLTIDARGIAEADFGTQLRDLRHDIGNRLNHVLGLCQLMMMEEQEVYFGALSDDLAKIRDYCQTCEATLLHYKELKVTEEDSAGVSAVELELAAVTPEAGAEEPSGVFELITEPAAVLVADDNEVSRDVLARALQREGHAVTEARDGREALDLLEQQEFDLVLLDFLMPRLNGYQVLRRLKSSERLRHTPVMLVSALDAVRDVVPCIELGAEDFLTKPVDLSLLRARVNACLEKKRLREREFGQFFTPELARHFVRHPELLKEGREAEVTVMFCDIRGFSKISEHLGPSETVEWVSDVMAALSDCVIEHRGVLVDYIGDELMAMWGAPEQQPNHAELACRAAIDMLNRLPLLSARWQPVTGHPTTVGIGLNTGLAQVGNTGSHRKFKYGPLGNSVNVASRVQGATKYLQTGLIVTGSTWQQLGPQFATRRLCKARVVNIEQPIDLYEVYPGDADQDRAHKRRYEEALEKYESQEFRLAASILGNLLVECPRDGASLMLMSRVVDALLHESAPFDPVWELPGK
jgi:adenylate cyclase